MKTLKSMEGKCEYVSNIDDPYTEKECEMEESTSEQKHVLGHCQLQMFSGLKRKLRWGFGKVMREEIIKGKGQGQRPQRENSTPIRT